MLTRGLQPVSMHLAKGDAHLPIEIQPGIKKHCCALCMGYCMSGVHTVHPFIILFILALNGIIKKRKKVLDVEISPCFKWVQDSNPCPSLVCVSPATSEKGKTSISQTPFIWDYSSAYKGRLFHEPSELLI